MGYVAKAARYVKFYRNVSESNELLGEDSNIRSGSQGIGDIDLDSPTTYFDIKIDIERSSTFKIAFEYKTDNNMDLNIAVYVNDTLVYEETFEDQAAYTAASFELSPYNDAGTGLYLNDRVKIIVYGNGLDNYHTKLWQIFGFETPIDPYQWTPA